MNSFRIAMVLVLLTCGRGICQTSFWKTSDTPGTPEDPDTASVTVGLKFYADVDGSVTGVRFYKGPHNTGTHVGNLWSITGTKLAEVIFSRETGSGWQQATFSPPISITAKTTYVISYAAPQGRYADDQYYSWSSLSAPPPLHVAGSSPSVYAYGSSAVFPTRVWNASNYWVDVMFAPSTLSTPSVWYTISGLVSGSGATLTLSGLTVGLTTTDATGHYTFTGLTNGMYVVAPSQSGYAFTPSTASVTINGASVNGVNFTATAVPAPVPHTVTLSWRASTSPNVVGYNVYRGTGTGGPYSKMNGSMIGAMSYVDGTVTSGQRYFYVATAVDSSFRESTYSTEVMAVIPTS